MKVKMAIPAFCLALLDSFALALAQEKKEPTAAQKKQQELHDGVQCKGGRTQRRRAQEVHERLPEGRCAERGANQAAAAHDGLQ